LSDCQSLTASLQGELMVNWKLCKSN
jgi:hypothetical protein